MSAQEAAAPKPEAKPRPDIPPKPTLQSGASILESEGGGAGGKVKRIVNKFSSKDAEPSPPESRRSNGGGARVKSQKPWKRAPTLKPKPGRASLPAQPEAERAPPLPMKRSRILQRQRSSLGPEDGVGVEGRRSEPDGKEVPPTGGGEAEPGSPLASPCCEPGCACVCHLHRPGMRLVWVPADAVDAAGDEDVEEDSWEDVAVDCEEYEHEDEVWAGDAPLSDKAKFHQSLNVLIGDNHRRRSDPGPHAAIASLAATRSESPPVPPKRSQSPSVQPPGEEEEESIYEATLPVVSGPPRRNDCRELDIPLIKVRKPARRSKLSYSTSDPTSEFQAGGADEAPPAVPPRMPVLQDGQSLAPMQRVGIPLPQPTAAEWRSLRPGSPGGSPASGGGTPPQPPAAASTSPRVPRRAPPPPPTPRRLSSASQQSLTQRTDGEENGERDDTPEDVNSETLGWESRLQDEPLYQTYRATVITKEIRRQTVCRNISKTSADYPMDFRSAARPASGGGGGGGSLTPRSSPVPTPGQSTLWQDIQVVRDSGVLEQLTSEQCKYQESMFEVLTSETSYLRSLRVLTEHFLDSRELEETMIIRDRKTLFSNVLRVREVSERFLKDLEDRIFQDIVFSDICDIIHYHAQHNFPAYIDYVRNQIYQEKTYTTLLKNNPPFAAVIARLQESPQCQRLPFMSFLLLPFQRITRIKMLIENILKRTKEGTKEEQMASKALASVSKIIDECNTQVGKMRQMEELIIVSQTLEFDKLKAIPIISQTRYLEKKGELQEMSRGATLFNMRGKFTPIYLFLFNDLLIIASKKSAERFVVQDHAHRSLVQVQPVDESGTSGSPLENCFNLTLLENHTGRMMERLMKAPSQSDMHRWMAAFPNPTNPDADDDEVIYDDWDCPQVQCVEPYIAQQADELTLEPTEIINVIRKTNEGWYEGLRLSDGQKGWFPIGNVIEITNEHVRRRNLRERYRVIQAASVVTGNKGQH